MYKGLLITLIKYSKDPKGLTVTVHRFIVLKFVTMLSVIYKIHEKLHWILYSGTLQLVNIASKSEYRAHDITLCTGQ